MTPKIGAILLAAGLSRRAGDINKLTARLEGTAIVRRCLITLVSIDADPLIVVTGHQPDLIEQALEGLPARFIHNPDFAEGMASSLVAGIQALPASTDAVLIALGDMPHVKPATYKSLINEYKPDKGQEICVPTFQGIAGNPVLFGRRFFADLAGLSGDVGGKPVIRAHPEYVKQVPVDDPGIQMDYDTVQGLE